jgi:DNA-binding transcriptional regulator WhiA
VWKKEQNFLVSSMMKNIHAVELSVDNIDSFKKTRHVQEIHEKLKETFLLRHKMHQQSILACTYGSRAGYSETKQLRNFLM